MAQLGKNPPVMQETGFRVRSLEEGISNHSHIPARKISWTEKPVVFLDTQNAQR